MSTTTSRKHLTWIGTAEVVPQDGNTLLGSATGAYVAVIGIANSEEDFHSCVTRAINALGFELVELDEVQQLESPTDVENLDEKLHERLDVLHEDNPVEFGSFHAFTE
jgi:ribonuclease PH